MIESDREILLSGTFYFPFGGGEKEKYNKVLENVPKSLF